MLKRPILIDSREKEIDFLVSNNLKNYDDLFAINLNLVNESKIKENINNNNLQKNELKTKETYNEEKRIENFNNFTKQVFIEIKKEEKKGKEKPKLLGRKKKVENGNTIQSMHNKFSDDNLRRKCKHIVLDELMKLINKKIYDIYNGDIGHGMLIKKLFNLNHRQKANASIKFNQEFLHKKIKDILSDTISNRYTNFPKEHNKNIIERLINENDNIKRRYFNDLFNLTFLECLNHFIEKERIEELEGMRSYEEILKQLDDDLDYKSCVTYYLMNFEQIINNKKSRKKRKAEININYSK